MLLCQSYEHYLSLPSQRALTLKRIALNELSINSENIKALGNSLTTNLDSSDSQGMSSQVTEWGLGISDVPPPDSTIDSARK